MAAATARGIGNGNREWESAKVKGYLGIAVKSHGLVVNTAKNAFDELYASEVQRSSGPSQRHLYYVSPELANSYRQNMAKYIVPAVPGVRGIHQIHSNGDGSFMYRKSSCYCIDECRHDELALTWKPFVYPGKYCVICFLLLMFLVKLIHSLIF